MRSVCEGILRCQPITFVVSPGGQFLAGVSAPSGPYIRGTQKEFLKMSRKVLSMGILAAAFCLTLGTTDAQACRNRCHHRSNRCCQNNNGGCQQASNCGMQQVSNNCQQTVRYAAPAATCCNAQSNACNVQNASFSTTPANASAQQPPIEEAPAPAPVATPAPAPAPIR